MDGNVKEFIFVQFPLSNLFSSSSFYDNKDHTIDLTKLDDYIREVMKPYMQYLNDDYKLYAYYPLKIPFYKYHT